MFRQKVKPLTTIQRELMRFGLYPFDENTSNRTKCRSIMIGSIYLGCALSACVSCETFVMKHVTTNLEDSLYALGQILIYVNAIFMMIFAFVQRYKIATIIEKLTWIYEKCQSQYILLLQDLKSMKMINSLFNQMRKRDRFNF